ncbi:hypothetical protein [Nocardioides rubriscoriae]|uniref:hypothetical protein n=1 Tax=Nocardioides rubriscoriae TaxID=642762 RepID=UPI0011DFC5AD|nr:hypothetical protein [Nocardioides rubriscoriae]
MSAPAARWIRRLVAAAVVAGVAVVVTGALDYDPEPVRLVLLVLLLVAGTGLLLDGLPRTGVTWYPTPLHPPVNAGRDEVTQAHVRLLEDHQRARHPDALLRERLTALADQVLTVRHGVPSHSERGRALLGADVVAVLHGPVARLGPRRIDQVLRRIEEL